MKVLVLNSGSSSLKYRVFDMTDESVLASGLVERIGLTGIQQITHERTGADKVTVEKDIPNHKQALSDVFELLTDSEHGVLTSLSDVHAVGHRVLHGKEAFKDSVLVDRDVVSTLKDFVEMGPLHMPANIGGIEACLEILGDSVPQVAVFDTAFHQTMPEYAYTYAIPYEMYEKYGVRRYGFHGTSHKYLTQRAAEILGKSLDEINLITAHMGNGCSITAVEKGKCIDTSMGLTPLEGLVMGTRSGDLDPAVLPFLGDKLGLGLAELDEFLNKKSGLLGISGLSNDMRDIHRARKEGNSRAQLAFDMFVYRLAKYVGAYYVALGGKVDALVFAGGIGENDDELRAAACEKLSGLGIVLDESVNTGLRGKEATISASESKIRVMTLPTNEELMIARDTKRLAEGK
ncbi:MAG: acetate kinase [Firmicutes bacterium]|nr:acetate kinase [Bacillota bacterium]